MISQDQRRRTERQRERIRKLAADGNSIGAIARRMGLGKSTVNYHIHAMGLDISVARNIRCDECGALLERGRTQSRSHACRKPACDKARRSRISVGKDRKDREES